jgi:glyoxylate carboligase
VSAKHDFSAATMADGYSRSGGGLGVVAATSGGGALNLVAGLGESYSSRVSVWTSATPARRPFTISRYGAGAGSRSHSAWATASVPVSGWRSAVRRPGRVTGMSW